MSMTVADMLADLIGPPAKSPWSGGTPATSATSATNERQRGFASGSRAATPLRHSATAAPVVAKVAECRKPANGPQSEHPCGLSQKSQMSQGVAGIIASARRRSRPYRLTKAEGDAAHAEPWNDAAIARFVARVTLFMRRGISATDADDLAERLHLRDVQGGNDRVLCLECVHLTGRRCGNTQAAGVGRELPFDLMATLQRCPGFSEATSNPAGSQL